jgi:lipoprotein signal peptidase
LALKKNKNPVTLVVLTSKNMSKIKKSKLWLEERKGWLADHLFIIVFLLGLNLVMALLVREVGAFVINRNIFYLEVDLWVIILAVVGTTVLTFYLKLPNTYPVASVLIMAGVWSNLAERLIFGGVADYLDIYVALTNLADLQIWIGLVGLNFQIWFPESANAVREYMNTLQKSEQT